MKHYLKSNPSGGLLILINEKEKPEITTKSPNPFYDASLEKWLSSCQTIPVAKESEEKFNELIKSILGNLYFQKIEQALNEGILIPKENVEIRKVELHYTFTDAKGRITPLEVKHEYEASFVPHKEAEVKETQKNPGLISFKNDNFAGYIREPEKESQEQVELWKTIFDFFELSYFETEDYIINKLKSKFHITRIK